MIFVAGRFFLFLTIPVFRLFYGVLTCVYEETTKKQDKEYRLCWFRLNYAVRYDTVDDEDKHDHSGEQCKKCKEKEE